jgi:hypothetical protein
MKTDKRFEALLWQYRECWAEIRNLDNLIWQIPSITMAINSFFGIAYLGYAKTAEARMVLLFASFAFNLISVITLRKHRFLQIARTEDILWLQGQLAQVVNIRKVKWQTPKILCDKVAYREVPRDGMISLSAYRCLLAILCLTIVVISIVLLIEIYHFHLHLLTNR